MFTREQIKEIQYKLGLLGMKDTAFIPATKFEGTETVTVIQEALNKRASLKDIAKYITIWNPDILTKGDLISSASPVIAIFDPSEGIPSFLGELSGKDYYNYIMNASTAENYQFDIMIYNEQFKTWYPILGIKLESNYIIISYLNSKVSKDVSAWTIRSLKLTDTGKLTLYDEADLNISTGGGGGGSTDIDPSVFTALASADDSEVATANVIYDNGTFNFEFGLPRGLQGPKGEKGEKGDPGVVAVGAYTAFVYKHSIDKPAKPEGGSWDAVTNTFNYPSGWSASDNLTSPVWMSSKTFYADPQLNGVWSDPIQISGEKGADGLSSEMLFKLSENENKKPSMPEDPKSDPSWTKTASGISEDMQCEWVISRYIDESGQWSDWEGPSLWSKWGVNGQDGSSTQFIFIRNNTGEAPLDPTPEGWDNPESDVYEEYQSKEIEYVPTDWTDDAVGVAPTMKFEWVSSRKYKNGLWGRFSIPALWAHYGEDGQSGRYYITKYRVTENTSTVPSFVPDDVNPGTEWGAFPEEYDLDTVVWAIDALYAPSGFIGPWMNLRLVTGIKGSIELPLTYTSNYYTVPSAGATPLTPSTDISIDSTITSKDTKGQDCEWKDCPDDATKQWYQCVATIDSAENKIVGWGAISIWNGRDGDAKDGKYWDVRVAITDAYDIMPEINKNNVDPNFNTKTSPWVVVTSVSDLRIPPGGRMWETRAQFNPDGSFSSGGWCTPYPISGEQGPQGLKGDTGSTGVSGVTYEERYMRGNADGPEIAWSKSYASLRFPNGWEMSLPSTNAEYPYIWCIKARVLSAEEFEPNAKWSDPFRLSGINGIDGVSAVPTTIGVLTNPMDTVICDANGNVISGLPTSTTLRVLDGDTEKQIVSSSFGYEVLDGASEYINISANPTTGTITINSITPNAPKIINIKVRGKYTKDDNTASPLEYFQIYTLNKILTNELPIVANLINDSTTIPALSSGELLNNNSDKTAYEVENTFKIYVGSTAKSIDDIYLSNKNGVKLSSNPTGVEATFIKNTAGNYTGDFKISLETEAFTSDVIYLYITALCTHDGNSYSRVLPFRIVRIRNGEDTIWYELKSNHHAIVATKNEKGEVSYNPESITVSVVKHEGSKDPISLTPGELESMGVYIKVDNDSNTELINDSGEIDITELEDFEENITLSLVSTNGTTTYDTENIPLLTNGMDAIAYKIVASHDSIQYNAGGNIVNIEADSDGGKYVYCTILRHDPKNTEFPYITINNKELYDRYMSGYNLYVDIDGVRTDTDENSANGDTYIPGTKILANSASESIKFTLSYQTPGTNTQDIVVDTDSIYVIRPAKGDRGQLVYPAGTYSPTEEYTTTDKTAPYVYDRSDGKFYVLYALMTWRGVDQDNQTPSLNYNEGNNKNAVWLPFEMYEAIYADIGVFKQALVGSAVFYKDYMFSQQGYKYNVNTGEYEFSTEYQDINIGDPMNEQMANGKFTPSYCVNLKTGQVWFGAGKVVFYPDGSGILAGGKIRFNANGSGELAGGRIYWDKDGNLYLPSTIISSAYYDLEGLNIEVIQSYSSNGKAKEDIEVIGYCADESYGTKTLLSANTNSGIKEFITYDDMYQEFVFMPYKSLDIVKNGDKQCSIILDPGKIKIVSDLHYTGNFFITSVLIPIKGQYISSQSQGNGTWNYEYYGQLSGKFTIINHFDTEKEFRITAKNCDIDTSPNIKLTAGEAYLVNFTTIGSQKATINVADI